MSESYILPIVFSNGWEKLALGLAERVFSSHTSPFEKRFIVVPNEQVEEFLHFYLASRLGISAGIRMCSLAQGLTECFESISAPTTWKMPSFLTLSLQIEEQIYLCQQSE